MSLQQSRFACNEGARVAVSHSTPSAIASRDLSLLKHEPCGESREEDGGRWGHRHQIGYARAAAKLHAWPEAAPRLSRQAAAFPSRPDGAEAPAPSHRVADHASAPCSKHFTPALSFQGPIYGRVKTCLALLKAEGRILSLTLQERGKPGRVAEGQSITHRLSKPSTGPAALVSGGNGDISGINRARPRASGPRENGGSQNCCDPLCRLAAVATALLQRPESTEKLGSVQHTSCPFSLRKGRGRYKAQI